MIMKYSIVVPSYNSATTIFACLQSIIRQNFPEPYEIIVVDSSSDATPKNIKKHFPQVTLIHLDKKTEPGTARNIGIKQAKGEIVCLIDSDCIADPDWLHLIAAAHESNYGAVGGAILNGNPENSIGWASYLAEFREFFPFHARQVKQHIASCNISYKRRVFDRYGSFPSNFYPQEDLVFNLSMRSNRDEILFDPAIRVSHINKTSFKHFILHQYRIGRITARVLKEFPSQEGGAIAKSKLLTLLALPMLPFVKFIRTYWVAAGFKEYKSRFILVSPLLLFGLLIWGCGFCKEVLWSKGKKSDMDHAGTS